MLSLFVATVLATSVKSPIIYIAQPKTLDYTIGQKQPEIKIAICNKSESKIQYWVTGFYVNHRVDILDEKYAPQKRTSLGQNHLSQFLSSNRDKNYPVIIEPRKTYFRSVPSSIEDFDLKPGRYLLVITYQDSSFNKPMTIMSRKIPLTVKQKG